MTKPKRLRECLEGEETTFFLEAHNGISAKIVEQAGFEAIWASGFTIAASLGLADRNESSWTQVLEIIEFMCDSTTIPILADGDCGYGNFNNARRFACKLASRGVAGVCYEDKIFPKANSFIETQHPLLPVADFCAKIMAVRDALPRDEFVLVARTETLIAGRPMEEALERAHRYCEAGADAIFIHSKRETECEVLEFGRRCSLSNPIIIAPTTYPNFDAKAVAQAGITNIIWANHCLRAAVMAMRQVAQQVYSTRDVAGIGGKISSLDDIFQLTTEGAFQKSEHRYSPLYHPSSI
jgi:phosphoenolpyruvate phosphomutase